MDQILVMQERKFAWSYFDCISVRLQGKGTLVMESVCMVGTTRKPEAETEATAEEPMSCLHH